MRRLQALRISQSPCEPAASSAGSSGRAAPAPWSQSSPPGSTSRTRSISLWTAVRSMTVSTGPGTPPRRSRSAGRPAAARATSSVNRFAALKADTDVFTTFEGDNHVLLQLVAKGLLTDYASDFEDMDQFGMVRFVAGLAVETVLERTNVHKLIERVRDVLPGGDELGPGGRAARPELPADDAAVPRGAHALGRRPAAQARHRPRHEPRRGLLPGPGPRDRRGPRPRRAAGPRRVRGQGRDAQDGDTKVALGLLCDLFALSTIEADRAWFMEHGRLSSQRSKAISREVNGLCRQIRPLAVGLVDAFGVPPEMLRSPELVGCRAAPFPRPAGETGAGAPKRQRTGAGSGTPVMRT